MYSKFEAGHAYARRNGYAGSYEEYISLQYKTYREVCGSCAVKPLSKQTWFDKQP